MHRCPACPKSFPSPSKLQRHYVIHTGQKPFICTICGTSLTQSGHLKTHMQKFHQPRLPTDRLQDGIVARNQQVNNHKPAAGINAWRGSSNCNAMPSTVSPSAAYQLEWKRKPVAHKTVNPPKNMPHESDALVTQSNVSNIKDRITQKQSVFNAHNGYTSFTSSPHLWIEPPTRDKPKQYSSSRESGQTFSQQAYSKGHLQSQSLNFSGRKMTFKHQCPICLKTFCSPSKLQRHSLLHTGQKPYSCTICWKAFRQKVHLKSHLNSPNKCSLSVRTEREKHRFGRSGQASGLQLQSSSQQRPAGHRTHGKTSVELELQCNISVNAVRDLVETEIKSEAAVKPGQSFDTSSQCHESDEKELRNFTQKSFEPSQCMVSNRSVKWEGNLVGHPKMYRNLKDLGTSTTLQNSNLNISDSEEIRHLPELDLADPVDPNIIVKPETFSINCSDYDESLPQDWAGLQRETCKATSEQQKLHQCHACLKCFPSVSKLQRHVMTHTGQRPFGCEICGKRFRQKTHLRVHCRTHLWSRYHKQRSLYINRPPSCSGGFNRRTAADVPVQETVLHKEFETHTGSDVVSLKHLDQTPSVVIIPNHNWESDKLLPHISKKMEVGREVSTVTVKRTPTANLIQNPGKVQHKCFRCLKCFPSPSKLQRHEMTHTGLKLFPCVLCGKAFRQAAHLKTHERTHCERKPSKPVNQQENIIKLKADSQRQAWISVRIPQQNIAVNKGSAEGNEVSAVLCTGQAVSISKGNNLLKTKFESNVTSKKRKLHTCRICFQNFAFPYKLSRHLATHSGMRPYKCTLCSKTFTQLGHVKVHEHRCNQGNKVSHVQGEKLKNNYLQEKCFDDQSGCTDLNVDTTRKQVESHYTSVGHSFTDRGSSYLSEAIHTEWLSVSEVGLQEENNESEKKLRDDCYQSECYYDHATDQCSYSFPSDLSFEMDKLVQNQNIAVPLFSQNEGNAHNVEEPCQPKSVTSVTDSNKLLGDEPVTPLVDNQMQKDNYWCEPLDVFECKMCSASLKSQNDLEQHICSTDVQLKKTESARKHHCDICFKHFVSPSKLERHYLIHTGLRPFSCDICGKTFTQLTHARTHRLTH
ncbi:zinc finger protein 770-like [Clinocottus analis]|uniref:zinc finger protein 770-like n=1 Tax=Clinocottus analis TaxID=304258 RepID=UPI0035C0DC09